MQRKLMALGTGVARQGVNAGRAESSAWQESPVRCCSGELYGGVIANSGLIFFNQVQHVDTQARGVIAHCQIGFLRV